jgi:hypothetical protein
MRFDTLLIIAVLGTFLGGLLLSLIFPSFQTFLKRISSNVLKRPQIRGKKMDELRILESLEKPLLLINSIPRYPDELKAKDVRDILFDINEKIKMIKSKEFEEIKRKLFDYSNKAENLHVNMNSLDALKMLGRDSGMRLVEEIRKIVAEVVEDKIKDKKKK